MKFFVTKLVITFTIALWSQGALASFASVWELPDAVPNVITSVQIDVFDLKRDGGPCTDSQCFRADVYLNDIHVARWAVSPGKPHFGTDFVGSYTPTYEGRSFHASHLHQHYKNRFGDSMPWAAFIKNSSGGKSGYATHCGRVTGRRESHGCIRMVCNAQRNDARAVNQWIKEAFKNGGTARIWTRHMRP